MTYSIGIDSGSTATKGILLADGVITRRFLVPTPFRPATAITEAWETLREGLETTPFLTLTGYGRQLVDFADKQVTEISCHGLGARFLEPATRAVIDIGGQDSKVIRLNEDGSVKNFVMNDKCAAGTGRFLDVMSRVLEIGLQEMGDAHFKADCPANVSSTCTVFAESEVISQLSKGVSKENIAAGVHRSIASKACSLVYRVGMEEKDVMCGGVAQDKGVVDAIEQELKKKILVADNPQTTGALGAALIAFELAGKSS